MDTKEYLCKLRNLTILNFDNADKLIKDKDDWKRIQKIMKENTTIYVYENDDKDSEYKYIGKLANGEIKLKWKTFLELFTDINNEFIEFTQEQKIKEILLKERI